MTARVDTEGLLRELTPQVLGALARRYPEQFDACEDAVQEALIDAAAQWPHEGVPNNPRGWLLAVASRRLIDDWRSESSRRRREDAVATLEPDESRLPDLEEGTPGEQDDSLRLLFLCCHPQLTSASQIALTLRAVGGLGTEEIAAAFLVPEATMAQRISRAKQTIKKSGGEFTMPAGGERAERLRAVLHVLYLIFNEGYTASSGAELRRADLSREAIRLARMVARLLPADSEVIGLLALMLLTDARRDARTDDAGDLVPLAEQDRSRWDREQIEEGVALVGAALRRGPTGPYQVQAAIAALHSEATSAEATDWPQILALYRVLDQLDPSPIVTLNRAVAVAMVEGPEAGLDLLASLDGDERLAEHHRLAAVHGHLLEMAGERDAALECFREAARLSTSLPERRYLERRAAAIAAN
ncbi:MAG TPA: sigma-70 family RNA polymerase sigma factor [Solirubrobacterales bacterium]|nr:sigma-70 family RNA polymerase sigma factor [Solirubrobacterales bacterium]